MTDSLLKNFISKISNTSTFTILKRPSNSVYVIKFSFNDKILSFAYKILILNQDILTIGMLLNYIIKETLGFLKYNKKVISCW